MREAKDTMAALRTIIIRVVTGIVVLSIVSGTAESFMGLRAWAVEHGIVGAGSFLFPCIVDAFPLAAEGVLILAYIDRWKWKPRVVLWVVLTLGLAVSVALNVGSIHSTDNLTLATHGAFPVATWLSLVVGTVMFKRVMANKPAPVALAEEPDEPDVMDQPEPDQELDDELEYVSMQASLPDLKAAAEAFSADLEAGKVPGLNRIRTTLKVGHAKAPVIQAHLRELAAALARN